MATSTDDNARGLALTIYLNQATESGVRQLATGFEKATGHRIHVRFQAGAALNEKIVSGAPGDLFSRALEDVNEHARNGRIIDVVEYARIGNGIAVKEGARRFDISTPAAFRQAMLDATSIGHTSHGTGPFNTTLFQKLGIYPAIRNKIKIISDRLVAAAVAEGEAEVGIQQINVIQPYRGTVYLGPLPPELMEYGRIGVGLLAVSTHKEEARAFMRYMADPANGALLRQGFMEPVGRNRVTCSAPESSARASSDPA